MNTNDPNNMYNMLNDKLANYVINISDQKTGLIVLSLVTIIFVVGFVLLGKENKIKETSKNKNIGVFFINTLIMFVVFIILVTNIVKYLFGIDITVSLKNLTKGDIRVDIDKTTSRMQHN